MAATRPSASACSVPAWVRNVTSTGCACPVRRARPALRGTLVDLRRRVAWSGEAFRTAGVAERVTTIGQGFFDPLPAGADLYLLKNVLADWPDREATAILSRCAEAARPNARVVVLGGVSSDDARGPSP